MIHVFSMINQLPHPLILASNYTMIVVLKYLKGSPGRGIFFPKVHPFNCKDFHMQTGQFVRTQENLYWDNVSYLKGHLYLGEQRNNS